MKDYRAPWSKLLIIVSSIVTVLCTGISIVLIWSDQPLWAALAPLAIVCGGALFTIRGYTVSAEALLVRRLFWKTRLPLAGLQSARYQPDAMRRSIRLFGNGGLFSFSGLFRNKKLGSYRAFVTDPNQTVVLAFPERTVIVSPGSPEAFVRDLGVTLGISASAPS